MGFIVLVVVVTAIVLAILLRGPIGELQSRRRAHAQERKRQWRRQREADRERRRVERAMNPAKAAARKGEPKWQQVAERHGSKCWLCGTRTYPDDRRRVDVGEERPGATYPAVDYIVPIDRGGTYEMDNLRIAHRACRERRLVNPTRTEYGSPKRTFSP
jgi:5-methylcytosine-specific restriction endonuclease McrA